MELTLEQTLQKGIEAYKKGWFQEADRRYTAILRAQPKHPDVNHNMGVLAVAVGKLQEALPFFEIAIESNPNKVHFWLSYIGVLIKLNRLSEAKSLLDQAKSKGVKALHFYAIEKQLKDVEPTLDLSLSNQRLFQDKLKSLIHLHGQGQFEKSLIEASKLILKFPKAVILYNIIGVANRNLGQLDAAIESFKKAIKIKSDYAEAYNNMGNALKDQGKLDEAIKAFDNALDHQPKYPEAYNNMGLSLHSQGKLENAIDAFNSALSFNPNYAEAYNNLGITLKEQGNVEAAIVAFTKALSNRNDYAEAFNNIGVAFKDQGKLEAAIEAYRKALKINPNHAEAYNNLGNALKDQGKLEAAIEAFGKALLLKPTYSAAHNNIGLSLQAKGKLEAAIEAFKDALLLQPNYPEAYRNMGETLKDQGKLEEALGAFKSALLLKPAYAEALSGAHFVAALMSDWSYIKTIKKSFWSDKHDGVFATYGLLALVDNPSMHLKKTTDLVSVKYKHRSHCEVRSFQKNKRIKVGYFSSYFRQHPVSMLSVGMLEHQNKQNFETFAFHYGPDNKDDYNLRMQNAFDHFMNVSTLSDKDVAELAYKIGIDIAVEFNGLMKDGRMGILAHRPAPIQINYLAYPGTMGANFYDYIIADRIVIPENQKNNYLENIIYLPNSYMPQDNKRKISDKLISRNDCGLPNKGFVFCCFNNTFKISDQEFDIWMSLLSRTEKSVLWLLKTNRWAENNLRNMARNRGIDSDRLVFADMLPVDEHLKRLSLADLFLDTFNFNAHTTASDALWSGLPVITKIGKGFAARVGGSLLTSVGLPEMITDSEEEYEALALNLARDPVKLKNIKNKLGHGLSSGPLFDTQSYTKSLERAFSMTYKRHSHGLPPAELSIP